MKIGLSGLIRKRRTITVILSALLGIAVILIIIGFIPFSNNGIKNNIESILKEATQGSLTIDKMTITLWTGIKLENVHYSQNDGRGESVSCVLPRISVSYYLLPIAFKHLIVKNIRLEQPEIALELSSAKPLHKEVGKEFSFDDLNRVLETIPYTVIIRNISIVDAHTVVALDNRQAVDCKGMNLSMNVSLKRKLLLEGHLTFSEAEFFRTLRVSRLKMSVSIKDMEAEVDKCHAYIYGGDLSINGNVNLAEAYLNRLNLSLENLKLDDWYHSTGIGQGNLTGKVDAVMKMAPCKLDFDSLVGKGWIRMTNVGAHNIPLQKNLLLLLVIPKLSVMNFSRITSDFALGNGKLYTPNCKGKGDPFDFNSNGWVSADGKLSENVEGVFSKEFVSCLPSIVKNSLLSVEGDKDKRSFKCAISGTFKNPQCKVDERIQRRAVNNVFDVIGKGLGKLFK